MSDDPEPLLSHRMRTLLQIAISSINAGNRDVYGAMCATLVDPPSRAEVDALLGVLLMVVFQPGEGATEVVARIERMMRRAAGEKFDDDEPPW